MAVEQRHILNIGILDEIHLSGVLSNTTHAHSERIVAPKIMHEDIGHVGFRRGAVVSNIYADVGDAEPVHDVRIESIGIGRDDLVRSIRIERWYWFPGNNTEALVE